MRVKERGKDSLKLNKKKKIMASSSQNFMANMGKKWKH